MLEAGPSLITPSWVRSSRHTPTMGAEPEVWPVHPIAIPVALWTRDVGLPWVGGVPCHAGNKHAANEYAQIEGIRRSEAFLVRFWERLATTELERT